VTVRILLLTRSFNSLTQRLFVELAARGHELSVEFDIADSVTEEAVALFRPELIIAPYLQRAIPARVWRQHRCLIVHPGIAGDRGPSALDWAIMNGEREWGVTVVQAEEEMDAGPVWASRNFPLRAGTKSSLYRNEVTEAAVAAVLLAIERIETGTYVPQRAAGVARPLMKQDVRRIDWARDDTATVLRKIRAADGSPGVLDELFGVACHLFDACEVSDESLLHPRSLSRWERDEKPSSRGERGAWASGDGERDARPFSLGERKEKSTSFRESDEKPLSPQERRRGEGSVAPGAVIARSGTGILRATIDGAIRIGHCKRADQDGAFKLPVALAFPEPCASLPLADVAFDEIRYEEFGPVGVLHFAFYNGAMATRQCERLLAALAQALARPTRALVLAGGPDFFSNGIHLNAIEAAESPADESWRNINAIDDVCRAILETTDRLTIAALQGNAGAGGCFLAFACDRVWARGGVVLNPHYKNMGNLYGSEYWTFTLPRRVQHGAPAAVMAQRLPIGAAQAQALGLVDEVFAAHPFLAAAIERAQWLADDPAFVQVIADKRARRARDEAEKLLATYRDEELAQMRRNFYGFDPSYHYARSHFLRKVPPAWTPRHLARHREPSASW